MPKQEDDGELEHAVVAAWDGDPGRQDAWVNSSPRDSGDGFAISIWTETWTAVFRGADDDRVIAAAKKGAPTSWCSRHSLNKLASVSEKKYRSEKAHRLALEWTRRMQWMYDTYVTQDDEAKNCSDAHFACYHHAADWEAFLCTLVATDSVRNTGEASALFGLCGQCAIVVRVTR